MRWQEEGEILRYAVTDKQYALRSAALTKTLHPVLGHGAEVFLDVSRGDHLNTVTVGLNISPVLREEGVGGDGDGGERSSLIGSRTGGRVGNIGTDDHSWSGSELWVELGNEGALRDACSTTQLGVDLHADVGDVLGRCRHNVLCLENLGRNAEANVAGLLDAAVDVDVAVVHDEEEEAGHLVVTVASLVPGLGDC